MEVELFLKTRQGNHKCFVYGQFLYIDIHLHKSTGVLLWISGRSMGCPVQSSLYVRGGTTMMHRRVGYWGFA